ncbi:hypothetical protein N7U49_00165 [Streptomyces sp. AD2-2]|nr:hypothetical protein N7U49_00165 [Streptomyces sp. AD2-2]
MGLLHSGGPRVAQTGDGRLAIFARGTDNTLQNLTQSSPGTWPAPTSWADLGGIITTNPVVFPATDQGRLEVFARGSDNSLWCDYQTKPNGGTGDWKWKTLNGRITSEPAVFRNADDRMEVAVADTNRQVAVTYQQGAPSGTWTSEEGRWPTPGGGTIGDPSLIQAEDGRLVIFTRGGDNHLYRNAQNGPGGGYGGWEDHGGILHSDPTPILAGDGTMHVFTIGADGALWHLPQLTPNGGWGAWEQVSSPSDPLSHRPAAVLNSRDQIEVFARSHATHTNHYRLVNGAWSSPIRHDTGSLDISGPTAARNADGRLEFFYRGHDNAVWHTAEFTPGGPGCSTPPSAAASPTCSTWYSAATGQGSASWDHRARAVLTPGGGSVLTRGRRLSESSWLA